MAFLSLMSLGKAANQIGMLPAELLRLGEDGVIKMYVVGRGPNARHYLTTGDVEELTTVVRARKFQEALLELSEPVGGGWPDGRPPAIPGRPAGVARRAGRLPRRAGAGRGAEDRP